jgi:hypothetical protein
LSITATVSSITDEPPPCDEDSPSTVDRRLPDPSNPRGYEVLDPSAALLNVVDLVLEYLPPNGLTQADALRRIAEVTEPWRTYDGTKRVSLSLARISASCRAWEAGQLTAPGATSAVIRELDPWPPDEGDDHTDAEPAPPHRISHPRAIPAS